MRLTKRKYKAKIHVTILLAVFCACIVIGAVMYESSVKKLRDMDRQITSEKLDLVVSDLKSQYDSMYVAAQRISMDAIIVSSLRNANAYYERDSYLQLRKYVSLSLLSDNLFLYIDSANMVLSAEYGKSDLDVFGLHYGCALGADAIQKIIDPALSIRLTQFGQSRILCIPITFVNSRKATAGYVISDAAIRERIRLLVGDMNGTMNLYYDGRCFYSESGNGASLEPGVHETKKRETAFISKTTGRFQAEFIVSNDSAYIDLQNFGQTLIRYAVLLSAFFIVVAVCISVYNYRPIEQMVNKYNAFGGAKDVTDELLFFESLLDNTLKSEKQTRERLKQQYAIMQRQFKQLVLMGDQTHGKLAQSGFLDVCLPGPAYSACVFEAEEALEPPQYDVLETQIGEMSDESMAYCLLSPGEGRAFIVILSYEDVNNVTGAIENIRELCGAQGLSYIGASRTFTAIAEIPERVLEAQSGKPEPREAAMDEPPEMRNRHAAHILETIDRLIKDPNLSLIMLESELSLSSRYISRIIHDETRMSYKDYIINKRMEIARDMIENTDLSVTNVCLEAGYEHLSNFIKTFKKFYGETPSIYRERHTAKR